LTATPDATSLFVGWGGPSCSGTSPTCSVTLGVSNRVVAYFRSSFKAVAAGAYHTCALRPAGDVVCWGRNTDGQIGMGAISSFLPPTPVTGITNAIAVAAGGYFSCALIADGTVRCWGNNDFGQVGNGTWNGSSIPVAVSGLTDIVAVTAGGYHSCAVQAGGTVFCWGRNNLGQLGNGTNDPSGNADSKVPVRVLLTEPATTKIAAGGYHSCVIVAADSTVACWGSNSDGQLGIGPSAGVVDTPGAKVQIDPPDCTSGVEEGCGDKITFLMATTIAASIGVSSLAPLGGYHTVALDNSGRDWGWGNNDHTQIFPVLYPYPGSFSTRRPWAMKDPFPPSFMLLKIAAGAYHTCALGVSTAGVLCRGHNGNGESGPSPPGIVPMTTLSVDVAAGGYHTCSVLADTATPAAGAVQCWGENSDGQVTGVPTGNVAMPVVLPVP
jgi:alpha-tubulin suppressor-like RCC1 family protein